MFYFLFLIYLVLFCWLITRIKFLKNAGPGNRVLIFLFLIRMIAGLVNGYINMEYYQGTDISTFHRHGIAEYNLLFHNTYEYFINIFRSNHNDSYAGFMETSNSFWNDTRSNIIEKMLSIFDIFSGKNFYINTLFYNFLIFFGAIGLYKVFIKIFPSYSFVLILCIFLLPSVIYFSSSIHRDGLIFLSLSMLIYHLFFILTGRISWKRILTALFFLLLILLLRNFVFIILIPALLAWIIAAKKPKYAFIIFLGTYLLIGVLFFCSGYLSPKFDLPAHVSNRQLAFIKIAKGGASAININPLYSNFRSFLNNTPQALNHSLMRPYLTEQLNFLYIPAGLEIFFYELLFLIFIFFRKKNIEINPLIYFSSFFTINMFLAIGYTIPIIGAIVRYRSIYFPFILIPIICYTDWNRLKKVFT